MTDQKLIRAAQKWREDYYLNGDHIILLDALIDRLTALQAENAEKDGKIERLKAESVEKDKVISHRIDDVSKLISSIEAWKHKYNAMLAALSRVEAERDVLLEYANAQMECEMCKNDTFCPMENPMPENCALCELKPKCPCHPCKWEWRGAQGEG